jgi:hypothetical protein
VVGAGQAEQPDLVEAGLLDAVFTIAPIVVMLRSRTGG